MGIHVRLFEAASAGVMSKYCTFSKFVPIENMPDNFPRSMAEVDEAFIGKILDAKVISYEKVSN